MSENTPCTPVWPPKRRHHHTRDSGPSGLNPRDISVGGHEIHSLSTPLSTPSTPLRAIAVPSQTATSTDCRKRKQYRNGYEVLPSTPSFKPYQLSKDGYKRTRAFDVLSDLPKVVPCGPFGSKEWQNLATTARMIPPGASLRDFQVQCANEVLSRRRDICIVAPTGAGKSLLWCLPLLVAKSSISLVVTPYTSLGQEGEERTTAMGIRSIFIHSEQKSLEILVKAARGVFRVIFVCAEMLESPTFAQVLHTKSFQDLLGCIYVDEAHLVHESSEWRSSYSRLHQLRETVGWHVPLVAISATLPTLYRASLCQYIGLQPDYMLINLGNHRPELSIVVLKLQHDAASFRDLTFTIPAGSTPSTLPKTLIYCDDLEMLTKMFWWYHTQLAAMDLPESLVDILHAGLSQPHEEKALNDFRKGYTRILLGSEKIGAGINFPGVEMVVQYLIKKLTLAKLNQRCGRGGRTSGTTAVGYLLFQADLADENENGGSDGTIDPGLMELVRTTSCYEVIIDKWLENPERPPQPAGSLSPPRRCCSNCFPSLLPAKSYRWIAVDMDTSASATPMLSREQCDRMVDHLKTCRTEIWSIQWKTEWQGFGPKALVSDSDLENVAKHASCIQSLDDLRRFTQIPYFDEISPWLLRTVHEFMEITQEIPEGTSGAGADRSEQVGATKACNDLTKHGTESQSIAPRKPRKKPAEKLHPEERIVDFSSA